MQCGTVQAVTDLPERLLDSVSLTSVETPGSNSGSLSLITADWVERRTADSTRGRA